MTIPMLGEEFTVNKVTLPGFALRPAARSVNPYALPTQGFEVVECDGATLTFTRDADDVLCAAELRLPISMLEASQATSLVDAFLHCLGVPRSPIIDEVWRGRSREGDASSGPWKVLAERVSTQLRIAVAHPSQVSRGCVHCGESNVDRYVFCTHCGTRREILPFSDGPTRTVTAGQMREQLTDLVDPGTVRVDEDKLRQAVLGIIKDPPTVRVKVPTNVFVPVVPLPPPDEWTAPTPTAAADAPLLDHRGESMGTNPDLFVASPPEIGTVRSAATSIFQGEDALLRRLIHALPWALPFAAAAYGGVEAVIRMQTDPAMAASLGLVRWIAPIFVALVVIWLRLPARRVLSYVGTEGVAFCDIRFRVWPPRRPPVNVLRFAEVRDLQISIRHLPRQLDYGYIWRGFDGSERYRLTRRCRATDDGQRPLDRGDARYYDFCRAAERSWTLFLIERVKSEMARPGAALVFPVYQTDCLALRVEDGHLVFMLPGGDVPVPAASLSQVYVKDGMLHFTYDGGDIALPSSHIGNVTVLMLVMQHHLGVTVR